MSQLDSLEQFIRYGINYQVLEPLRRQRALDYAEKKADKKEAEVAKKASGKQKLKDLGLDDDEIKQLTGA